jgi:hypothetical protein
MDSIDKHTMLTAGQYVHECSKYAFIHTVTITLNGATGGATVLIQGEAESEDPGDDNLVTYERVWEVAR